MKYVSEWSSSFPLLTCTVGMYCGQGQPAFSRTDHEQPVGQTSGQQLCCTNVLHPRAGQYGRHWRQPGT